MTVRKMKKKNFELIVLATSTRELQLEKKNNNKNISLTWPATLSYASRRRSSWWRGPASRG